MPSDRRDGWIGLLSFGFFIMLFALFFIIVPDYYTEVSKFFEDFLKLKPYPDAPQIYLPFPGTHHPVVYETVMRFCVVYGLFQFFVLALRFYFKSSTRKVAETISNIVTWLGAAYVFNLLYLEVLEWFPFIGGLLVIFGVSLIARSLFILLASMYKR